MVGGKVFHRLKISPNVWMDLDTFELRGNWGNSSATCSTGREVYSNSIRFFVVYPYYVMSSEGIIGPFRNYEDALKEVELIHTDQFYFRYNPGLKCEVRNVVAMTNWQWRSIISP